VSKSELQVFAGNAHPDLAHKICAYLGIPLGDAYIGRFPDGEIDVKINDDVRGSDVFVVQTTCTPVNENLMELLIMIDTLRRASARRITAVIPYYGYARKDRKDEGRVPITAKLVANLLVTAGVQRVISVDLHASQIQGFFDIPVDHLYATPVFFRYLKDLEIPDMIIVAPDAGSIKMNRAYAREFKTEYAIVDKRRLAPNLAAVYNIIGDVQGRNVVIVDDMIATGGSIAEACKIVKERGAKRVFVCATHAVLAGDALRRLDDSPIEKVAVTDTIPLGDKQSRHDRVKVLTIAPLLGEAIRRIHRNESVSYLFNGEFLPPL
jgi:ribose-phosphate pyrophosphokinase